MQEQTLAFAQEKGLDEATTTKVLTELDSLQDDIVAVRKESTRAP